jgi:hypothetical protein
MKGNNQVMRLKPVGTFAVLVAMLAMGAITAGAASASTTPEWFYSGKNLSVKPAEGKTGAGKESISASATAPFVLQTVLAKIECTSMSLSFGQIAASGTGSVSSISLKGCKWAGSGKCLVPATITTGAIATEQFYVNGSAVWDEYRGVGSLTSVLIEGCSLEGTYRLNGALCAQEIAPATEAVTKEQVLGVPKGEGAHACGLSFGAGGAAKMDGSMALSLSGSQLGASWTGR